MEVAGKRRLQPEGCYVQSELAPSNLLEPNYLPHLIKFFQSYHGDTSGATEYFQNVSKEKAAVLKSEAKFVVEHCKLTVDLHECLQSSSCKLSHKLSAKLNDLKCGFKEILMTGFLHVIQQGNLLNKLASSTILGKLFSKDQKLMLKIYSQESFLARPCQDMEKYSPQHILACGKKSKLQTDRPVPKEVISQCCGSTVHMNRLRQYHALCEVRGRVRQRDSRKPVVTVGGSKETWCSVRVAGGRKEGRKEGREAEQVAWDDGQPVEGRQSRLQLIPQQGVAVFGGSQLLKGGLWRVGGLLSFQLKRVGDLLRPIVELSVQLARAAPACQLVATDRQLPTPEDLGVINRCELTCPTTLQRI
ncbi:hypothetical protein PR048_010053 [Dryococelus australis]|uniref:Uncharacterized protein n=1 Tax=Dryococelus australis TaxID=614101 RepID=A0ABQ9I2L8_9NEOP|nr:hypothetical protein PR048_010053 [Dryococelus australis]